MLTRCQVITDGNIEGTAPFEVSRVDLCIKDYDGIRQYVIADMTGKYTAFSPSKDAVFPDYGPDADRDPSGRAHDYPAYANGDSFAQSLNFAIDNDDISRAGSVTQYTERSEMDGAGGYYNSYRGFVEYDSRAKRGTLSYERKYGLILGKWKPVVRFAFRCR